MLRYFAPLTLAALLAAPAMAQTAPTVAVPTTPAEKNAVINAELPADQAAMKAHVMFLASDNMRGRDAGSPEFDIAAQYVASQFYAAGLRPAGDDGSYLQRVPLLSFKPAGQGSFTLTPKGKGATPISLEFGKDYVPSADPTKAETKVEGQVVFVGYGITAPSLGRDDYRGVNAKGKIVAFFSGAPAGFPGEERAHLGSPATKAVIAQEHGAIGYITIESPVTAKTRPFSPAGWDRVRMTWQRADGTGFFAAPNTPSLGTISIAAAEKLFAGSKTPWATVAKLAESDGAKFKAEVLPTTLSVSLTTDTKPVVSYNVAGIIPGSDPTLGSEVVILSAHLDHVGVGRPNAKGDTIYNGAMDNAVGIASLIEEAKRFKASGKPPRRTIMFLAVTAEEKGLVGADYFAHNPTVPKDKMVANVNLDMPIITYKFSDIIVFGAPRSTLGPIVEKAAAGIGVTISPDPMPEQGLFVRSDHYRFIQQGVPSVFLWPGAAGPGKTAIDTFFAGNYHQPSDEIVQGPPIDWESGVRFIEINYTIARAIADADERPVWNKGDFFGTLFKGPIAK
ncbi:M28 family metallopeptidase [Sphingomonas sp. AOB5]|uniref:M28 family metallopeptidase n=1 Tax=Sphingomonas sp. AOB5 TaxID=3034017 RepID=UPI0023F646DE|nr:M28 family metallopeptidase [Sphingomonas sp. AOB5]MDF7776702.1 M28 family metallopeptidase [Sphingomonas sp. AOB5]